MLKSNLYKLADTTFLSSFNVLNYIKCMVSGNTIRTVYTGIVATIMSIIGFFEPLHVPIIIMAVLTTIDTYLGCRRAYLEHRPILSGRLWRFPKKLFWEGIIVALFWVIDIHIVTSLDLHSVEFAAGAIAATELWSIVEHLNDMYPYGPWRILRKVIKSKSEKYLNITIDKEDLPLVQDLIKTIK